MNGAFADTSFYIALLNPRDDLHSLALEASRHRRGQIVTSEYVLLELANHLSGTANRQLCSAFVRHIQAQPRTTVVHSSKQLFETGMGLYESRLDKNWSLTDCLSFVIMQQRNIEAALTNDHHFEQAGFNRLLK